MTFLALCFISHYYTIFSTKLAILVPDFCGINNNINNKEKETKKRERERERKGKLSFANSDYALR